MLLAKGGDAAIQWVKCKRFKQTLNIQKNLSSNLFYVVTLSFNILQATARDHDNEAGDEKGMFKETFY